MTLLGPADADHYRVKVGRFANRFYVDPLPACEIADATDAHWPAISTVKKASTSDWTFVALKRVAEALDKRPTDLDGLSISERYERLQAYNKTGLGAAAERGTNVHTYFEMALKGTPPTHFLPGEPGSEYLDAVRAFMAEHKPELVAAELVTINRDLNGVGYGGTLDAIVRIGGKCYIVDWKSRGESSSHGAYAEEAAQVGGYAMADYAIAASGRIPMPHLDGGLIVSVKPDGYRIYPIDLEAAANHWRSLHSWWVAGRSATEAIGKPWAPSRVEPVDDDLPDGLDGLRDLWTISDEATRARIEAKVKALSA